MERNEKPKELMRYSGLATQWMAMLLISVWAGYKLDHWIHLKALFLILLPVGSLSLSMWQLIKELNKPKK
jgi:F0F1-type ATP synthase assembly protein I